MCECLERETEMKERERYHTHERYYVRGETGLDMEWEKPTDWKRFREAAGTISVGDKRDKEGLTVSSTEVGRRKGGELSLIHI